MTIALFWRLCAFGYVVSNAQFPPQFIKEPTGYTYPSYMTVKGRGRYTCQSNGTQPIVHTWYYGKFGPKNKTPKWKKDYKKLTPDTQLIVKDGDLIVEQMTQDHAGFYRCTAKNKYGTAVSNAVRLMHSRWSAFQQHESKNYTATEGDHLILPCRYNPKIRPSPEPRYEWKGQVQDLDVVTDQKGNLHFLFVEKKHGQGKYRCHVVNSITTNDTWGNYAWIAVKHRVGPIQNRTGKIIFSSPMTYVWPGKWSTLYLQCIPSGFPLPRVVWKRKGKIIKKSAGLRFSRKNNYTLEINPVSEKDAGNYTCYLENNKAINKTMKVIVNMAPIPTVSPQNTIVVAGSTAEISCDGRPPHFDETPIHIDWFQNGEKLEPSSEKNGLKVQSNKLMVNAKNLTTPMSAAYSCILRNHIGDTTIGFTIHVIDEIKINSESVNGTLGKATIEYDSKTRAPTHGLNISLPVKINIKIKISVDKLVEKDLRVKWMHNDRTIDNTNPLQPIFTHENNVFLLTINADSAWKMHLIPGKYSVMVFVPYVKGSSKTLRMLNLVKTRDILHFGSKHGKVSWIFGVSTGLMLLVLCIGLLYYGATYRRKEVQKETNHGFKLEEGVSKSIPKKNENRGKPEDNPKSEINSSCSRQLRSQSTVLGSTRPISNPTSQGRTKKPKKNKNAKGKRNDDSVSTTMRSRVSSPE